MHIVFVEFPPSGGLYQFTMQLATATARQGHKVTILTGPKPEIDPKDTISGLRVRPILPTWHPTAGADAPDWWRRARRGVRAAQLAAAWIEAIAWLKVTDPDAVVWSSWRNRVDAEGVRLARLALPRTALALVAHEPVPLVEQPGSEGALEQTVAGPHSPMGRAYASIDAAFVLGDGIAEVLKRAWQPTSSVTVIPHGPNTQFPGVDRVGRASDTRPSLLLFGTITGYKGHEDLLNAWPKIVDRVPDATLSLVGNISADVDAEALRARVDGLTGVDLQSGYVSSCDVASHFAKARAVVLPYRRASQSGVAHTAHAFGRPVIATRVGDIPSAVRDGVDGWIVEPGDEDELVEAVVEALTDPEKAGRLGDAGRDGSQSSNAWEIGAERLVDALRETPRLRNRNAGTLETLPVAHHSRIGDRS